MANSSDCSGGEEVALIVGGGPGISASCARLFAAEGMKVAVAARTMDKPVLQELEQTHGIARIVYSDHRNNTVPFQTLEDIHDRTLLLRIPTISHTRT